LASITFQLFESDGTVLGWKDYRMRVGTFSGGVFDPTIDEVTRHNPDEFSLTYFTYTFDTPLNLAASKADSKQ